MLHWRRPGRAVWTPLLDTKLLPRLASGRKKESYYPTAVANNKFHCIILKGGDQYPYFPRPLLSEFDFSVPITSSPPKDKPGNGDSEDNDGHDAETAEEQEEQELKRLYQAFMLDSILVAQTNDLIDTMTSSTHRRKLTVALGRKELEIDKTLLQLLAAECRAGEERGPRALELVRLMRDRTGRMVEAACKVAERYGRTMLGDKIREIGERRLAGEEDDEEEDRRGDKF